MSGLMARRSWLPRLALPALSVLALLGGGPLAADARPSPNLVAAAVPAGGTWFFNWYDRLSPGMSNDNIHLVNPSPTATVNGVIRLGAVSVPFGLGPGVQTFLGLGANIGGPVMVTADGPLVTSQRVSYFRSF